jgi:hypothetical protein
MVAPDARALDIVNSDAKLQSDLRLGTVVVEERQCREVLGGDRRRRRLEQQAVGVGRVGNHNDLVLQRHRGAAFNIRSSKATACGKRVLRGDRCLSRGQGST